jgi:hypothetical protein
MIASKLHRSIIICLLLTSGITYSQEWMSNLKVAQNLALVQNKMVLMIWEEETFNAYPVVVDNTRNQKMILDNLFEEVELNKAIWEYFIPVVVSEYVYDDLYEKIKNKRSQSYIDKLSDASLKVMDIHGNIVNVTMPYDDEYNLSQIIRDYAFNTEFLNQELRNYKDNKNFLTAYFLASKYLDFAAANKAKIRPNIINLAKIYIQEAKDLLPMESDNKQDEFAQRLEMLRLQADLLEGKAPRVIRILKKMEKDTIFESNKLFQAFLNYTAYKIRRDNQQAAVWKSQVSSVNLNKADAIIKASFR